MTTQLIQDLLTQAKKAQKTYEHFSQKQVDQIVRAVGKAVYDNAEVLSQIAIDETRMGVYEDKVFKNKNKPLMIWNRLKNKKSVGIIGRDQETNLVFIAKPMGIVGSVTPVTNPIATSMCNAMFALKGRNAIIVAPHPRAKECTAKTIEICSDAIKKLGAPEHLMQIIEEPSIELTNELMKSVDVVIATGGMAMVKAAYSSGKPSYGVGAGNVQVIFDRDIDFNEAAQKVILGRKYDNGIICSGEQSVIAHKNDYSAVIEAFIANKAYYVSDKSSADALRAILFVSGILNKEVVGQSAIRVAKMAGVSVPNDTQVLLIPSDATKDDVLRKEKMCPVLALFTYETFEEALDIAQSNLEIEGKGHSCAIHSTDKTNVERAGAKLTVSRLVVNQPSATSAGGSFFNGFAPTSTLGCGSWGNNSISENLDYKHLINIQRIGFPITDKIAPTEEEIWA